MVGCCATRITRFWGCYKRILFGHNHPQLLVDADQGSELEQNLLGETESLEGSVSAEPSMAVESSSTSLPVSYTHLTLPTIYSV